MKVKVLRIVIDKLIAHAAAKEHSIDRKNLGRYVEIFYQDEYSEMKPNYLATSVVLSSVAKSRIRKQKKWDSSI